MRLFKISMALASLLVLGYLGVHFLKQPEVSVSTSGFMFEPDAAEGTAENPVARRAYDWQRLHDPATGHLPYDIARNELAFVHQLTQQTQGQSITAAADWTARGPHNIGGRTRALAIDITNEDVLLAGGVSSGMFKSTDGGASWRKTTSPNQLHSVTALAQNTAPGRTHIWYYGTGDRSPGRFSGESNSAQGLLGTNAFYRGDGIFKSTDGGDTWAQLPATVSGSPDQTDPFDFIWEIVTFGEDGVLAATHTGLYQSTDGGASWSPSLTFAESERYPSTEVAITGDGTWYATVGGDGPDNGVYRSTDEGATWENISPAGWPAATVRTVMGAALSNNNVLYFYTEVANLQQQLRKYEAGVGWTDLTAGLPFNAQLATFGGTLLMVHVKPDDENALFLGAINLFRSTDGGASFEVISGTGANFHPDQFAISFYPSDPRRMIVGNDGGLYRTDDNVAATTDLNLNWESLNNGYLTTQFYTVAVDHGTPGSEVLLGGTQDNGVVYTASSDPEAPWRILLGGDGGTTAIANGGNDFYYATAATFRFLRHTSPGVSGEVLTEITPASGRLGLWLTLFQLDPHDENVVYLPSQQTLWRNNDLSAIPRESPGGPTEIGWDTFEHVTGHYIHALSMSEAEPRRLYYAAADVGPDADERLFYLADPQQGQPVPVDITGENFPYYPYVPFIGCITVDPRDANKVIVVFPSYGVLSIYATEDGGQSWTPVSGNLEENTDGTGSGPSVRWVSVLYVDDQPVYLAGTSVGLFSAAGLDGMNTRWVPEATSTIGNVVVDMIDVRQSDGFVAVATHGNGMYSTYINAVPTRTEPTVPANTFTLAAAYPNPFNTATTVPYALPRAGHVTAHVYNVRGQRLATLFDGWQQGGQHNMPWDAREVASGTYFVRMSFENMTQVQQVIVQR